MATRSLPLDNTAAVDVKASLSLVEGLPYSIQARGGNVLLTEQSAAPTIGVTPTHLLENDGPSGTYKPTENEALYAWAQYKPCAIVVTEA